MYILLYHICLLILLGSCSRRHELMQAISKPSPKQIVGNSNDANTYAMHAQHDNQASYVIQSLLVRREPSENKYTAKKMSNIVTTLYRGEQVVALPEYQHDFQRIDLSDGKKGWVKADGLIAADGVTLATVLQQVKTFYRPDLLALNLSKQLLPGTLLIVLRQKDQFTEVNTGINSSVWLLSDVICYDTQEVSAAKLVQRARILKDRGDTDADAPLEFAKSHFANTQLMRMLVQPEAPAVPNDSNVAEHVEPTNN